MKRTKSILALFLAVVFVLTGIFTDAALVKTNAAGEDETTATSGGTTATSGASTENYVTITKAVGDKITDDGGVDITLTINVNKKVYNKPVIKKYDIVLLLDASGSMRSYASAVASAAEAFVKTIQDQNVGDNVQIAVMSFGGNGIKYLIDNTSAQNPFASFANTIKVNAPQTQSGTPLDDAMEAASSAFTAGGRSDAKKVVVVLTDGEGYEWGGSGTERENHIRVNKAAIAESAKLKNNGAEIYIINYRSESEYSSSRNARLYFETMIEMSSETFDFGEENAKIYDTNADITDFRDFKTYYFPTSLKNANDLNETFQIVAKTAVDVKTIGSETNITEELPEYFHVAVADSNAELKYAEDNNKNDITDYLTATYENVTDEEGNVRRELKLNLGTLVEDEAGNKSLGNLVEGTYKIVYTARLDEGVTAEMLQAKYGKDGGNILEIAFSDPAKLTYIRTDEQGNVQENLPENLVASETITVESNTVETESEVYVVSFYINGVNVQNSLAMKGDEVTAPVINSEANIERFIKSQGTDKYTDDFKWDTDAYLDVQGNTNVHATLTPIFTVEFSVFDENDERVQYKTYDVVKGGSVTAPEIVLPEDVVTGDNKTTYSTTGWTTQVLEAIKNVQGNINAKAYIIENKTNIYTVTYLVDGARVFFEKVLSGDSVKEYPDVQKYKPEDVNNEIEAITYAISPWSLDEDELTNITSDVTVTASTFSIGYKKTYPVTIKYVDKEGNDIDEAYTDELEVGESLTVQSPDVEGFTTEQTTVTIEKMPAKEVEIVVVYEYVTKNVYFYVDGKLVNTIEVRYGADLVDYPAVTEYASLVPANVDNAEKTVVYTLSDWDKTKEDLKNIKEDIKVNAEITSKETKKSYTLTINYVNEDGETVAESYVESIEVGAKVVIDSPVVEGFSTEQTLVTVEKMPAEDLTITVVYAEDEIIEDPEIPQEEPEDPVEVIEDPDIPQTEPEDPVEDIEDPIIPQEDPVVPQTGDKKGFAIVTASAALLLALATLLNKKRR